MQPHTEPETATLTDEDRAIIHRQGIPPSTVAQRIRDDAYHSEWLSDCMPDLRAGETERFVARAIARNIKNTFAYGDPDNPRAVY